VRARARVRACVCVSGAPDTHTQTEPTYGHKPHDFISNANQLAEVLFASPPEDGFIRDRNMKGQVLSVLTFQNLAVSLCTNRFNIQKFYMLLSLRWVFCTDLRANSDFCFIQY